MAVGVALMVASVAMSAMQSQQAAAAQANQLNEQAQVAQNQATANQEQAQMAKDQASVASEKSQQAANQVIGRENALAAASGAIGDTGTFTDVVDSSIRNEQADEYNYTLQGNQQAALYQGNAQNLLYMAQGYRAQAGVLPGLALMGTAAKGLGMAGSALMGGMGGGGGGMSFGDQISQGMSNMYGTGNWGGVTSRQVGGPDGWGGMGSGGV